MIRDIYDRIVADAVARAATVCPPVLGLTASIDEIYSMGRERLVALSRDSLRSGGGRGSALAREILDRVRTGRGGEIVHVWDGGPAWVASILGEPDVRQIGGNAAQASWTLATMGAPAILSLADRSPEQLEVLDPRMLVATQSGIVTVSDLTANGSPTKWAHGILEFTAGTPLDGVPLPRSTRLMLRFSHEPLETDSAFEDYVRTHKPRVALLSGLATQPSMETADVEWAVRVAAFLKRSGALVHHELSEFATPVRMRAAIDRLPATSLGMSLSELRTATRSSGNPLDDAVSVAQATSMDRVVVHADDWSMIVTRTPTDAQRDALVLANALASARARLGHPADPESIAASGHLTKNHPASGLIRDNWHAIVVPSLYQPNPVATVGLGDTFTAGLLLGDSLHPATD